MICWRKWLFATNATKCLLTQTGIKGEFHEEFAGAKKQQFSVGPYASEPFGITNLFST
jgi:hypothetical protein